jgi:hypothetical protein
MDRFPLIHRQRAGGGINCSGLIHVDGPDYAIAARLRCDERGHIVGTINRWILRDLVNLTTNLDEWQPTPEGINSLPAPLQTYLHDLETRPDPSDDVQELALAWMTIVALQLRIRELESC